MSDKKDIEKWVRKRYKEDGKELPSKFIVDDNIEDPEPIDLCCYECGKMYTIVVEWSRYEAWLDRQKLIQDAMPGIEPGYRELFKTNICPKCWKKMFGSPNRRRR